MARAPASRRIAGHCAARAAAGGGGRSGGGMRGIRIGLSVADTGGVALETLLAQLRGAEQAGFDCVWIPNIFGMDALSLAALGGRETRSEEHTPELQSRL